ncbi:hypothetical protein V5738_11035 [Salinisphaera sp. SPP-AMP-43]|uniref:helix-turn-helix domain-containing protein n=1 Tax=Salinisphaera sp. SPP-AMP-43 TaxID=3121288 RepID=UPI003C6DFCBF
MSRRSIAHALGVGVSAIEVLEAGQVPAMPLGAMGELRRLTDERRPHDSTYSSDDAFSPGPLMASRASKPERSATARNLESAIRERVSRITQCEVARLSGIEKTAIHRLMTGERGIYLDELHDVLAALGMAIIECDGDLASIPRAEYDALRTLAKRGLE